MSDKKVHQGRNIKRFREMLGIKQEAIAITLGEDWTQKKVSLLEAKDTIDPPLLQQIANILKVPVEAIENLDDDGAINIISSTFNDDSNAGIIENYKCNFNPLDKMVELYERMLQQQAQMIDKLEQLINDKK